MAKTVFRPAEIVHLGTKFMVEAPGGEIEEAVAEPEPFEEYSGPTADELRREAEAFKADWEREKEAMAAAARAEAEEIIRRAESAAFEDVKRKTDQAQKLRREAEEETARLLAEAESKVRQLEAEAMARVDAVQKDAFKKGFEQGREEGYKEGVREVERLVDRLHIVIDRALDKRNEILEKTEGQIVELVLLVARKVVKVISENQKNVVVSNIAQALRKLKARSEVTIKVNLADLQLASDHLKDFIAMAENAKNLVVVEDTSIDRGGCVIETDFGEIDARIQSQLHELEEKILDISPIKARGKVQS